MSKREDILESALSLFSSQGYESVGIQKIVDSVSVTKPTLYHYFGSKQGLLDALLENYYTPFLNGLNDSSVYSGDIVKTLENVTKYFYDFAKDKPTLFSFILTLNYAPSDSETGERSRVYCDRQLEILENIFKKAELDHGNMKGRSFSYSVSLLGVITSYIVGFYNSRCQLDDSEVYQLCRQFMYGIFS